VDASLYDFRLRFRARGGGALTCSFTYDKSADSLGDLAAEMLLHLSLDRAQADVFARKIGEFVWGLSSVGGGGPGGSTSGGGGGPPPDGAAAAAGALA